MAAREIHAPLLDAIRADFCAPALRMPNRRDRRLPSHVGGTPAGDWNYVSVGHLPRDPRRLFPAGR
eukprot:803851-Alexandrium_andersonii.AAC.1